MAYIKNPVQAVLYSKFRPSPPTELMDKIIDFLSETKTPLKCALDVGCGSGQSTKILAPYFTRVVGIDNSQEQLQQAHESNKLSNVSYRIGSAEQLGELDGSVALVTAGMAVHWFDLSRFSAEVARVLCPNGVLALYGYNLPRPTINGTSLADTVQSMFGSTLSDYMPHESRMAYFDGYKGDQFSKFHFSSQPSLRFEFPAIIRQASVSDLFGYITTTSAFQNYWTKHGEAGAATLLLSFKSQIAKQLDGASSLKEATCDITFPYFLLLSRKDM